VIKKTPVEMTRDELLVEIDRRARARLEARLETVEKDVDAWFSHNIGHICMAALQLESHFGALAFQPGRDGHGNRIERAILEILSETKFKARIQPHIEASVTELLSHPTGAPLRKAIKDRVERETDNALWSEAQAQIRDGAVRLVAQAVRAVLAEQERQWGNGRDREPDETSPIWDGAVGGEE
jgi:hypothetical protein